MGSYSNTLRYTGLSGIDTETMIQSLMKAESMKYNKLEQSRTLLQWKQDAYRSVATSLSSFQSQFLSFSNAATNMRGTAVFESFKFSTTVNGQVSSSVKVSAGTNAKAGTHKMEILRLAQSDLYEGTIQNSNAKGTTGINLANLSEEGGSFNVKLDNGVAKTITFSATEIGDINNASDKNDALEKMLNKKLKDAFGSEPITPGNETEAPKVTATVDSNGVISFKPKDGHSITLSNTTPRVEAKTSKKTEAQLTDMLEQFKDGGTFTFNVKSGSDTTSKPVTITVPKLDTTKSVDAQLSQLVSAVNKGFSEAGFGSVSLSASKGDDGYTLKLGVSNTDANISISETTSGGKITTALGFSNEVAFKSTNILSDFGFKNNTSSKLDTSKKISDVFGGLTGAQSITINGKNIEFNGDETINSLIKKVNDSGAGVTMKYNTSTEKFEIEANHQGAENKITFGDDTRTKNFIKAFGLGDGTTHNIKAKVEAQDAIIKFNNQTYYRSSNNVELEGFNLQLIEKTEADKPITISAERDTSATLDAIKGFVESYNNLLEMLQNEYSTTRSKKSTYDFYQPLTSEEKSAMTETEIANWEKEAKTGVLYRDDTINDILSTMRSIMYESVDLGDGKGSISLYEIGITTSSNVKDGGKLIIDEDKLSKALVERGNDITTLFTKSSSKYPTRTSGNYRDRLKDEGIAERLNDIVNYATSSATGTITLKAGIKGGSSETLNDMYKLIKDMDDRLYDMYRSLMDKEDYYYRLFSKMESAITQNNNQMATLQSMFGV